MTKLIEKQFEANLKANTDLIAICMALTAEQLAVEVEGIFGRIKPLLAHIVGGESDALRDLSGTVHWPEDTDWDGLSFEQLLEIAQQTGTALTGYATRTNPDRGIRFENEAEVSDFKAWVVINEVIHHGIEHRTQIHALLTKLGVAHPRQDVWHFAASLGDSKVDYKTDMGTS